MNQYSTHMCRCLHLYFFLKSEYVAQSVIKALAFCLEGTAALARTLREKVQDSPCCARGEQDDQSNNNCRSLCLDYGYYVCRVLLLLFLLVHIWYVFRKISIYD